MSIEDDARRRFKEAIERREIPEGSTFHGIDEGAGTIEYTTPTFEAGHIEIRPSEWAGAGEFEDLSPEDQALLQEIGAEAFSKIQLEKQAEWEGAHIQLDSGEWVSIAEWGNLTPEQQAELKTLGVEAFMAKQASEQAQWEASHVQLDSGEWITKEDFDALTPDDQRRLKELGVEGFNALKQQEVAEWEDIHVQINEEEWIPKEEWDALTPEQQEELKALGVDAFIQKREEAQAEWLADNVQINDEEWVTKVEWEALSPEKQAELKALGVAAFNQKMEDERIAWEAENIHLEATDEWVAKEDWDTLDAESQQKLMELGVDGFGAYQQQRQAAFEATHVELDNGEWVDKTEFGKLNAEDQAQLRAVGVDEFNALLEQERAAFEVANVQLTNFPDDWVDKMEYEALDAEHQAKIQELGVDGFNAWLATEKVEFEAAHVELDNGDWIGKEAFDALNPEEQSKLMRYGVDKYNSIVEAQLKEWHRTAAYAKVRAGNAGVSLDMLSDQQIHILKYEDLDKAIADASFLGLSATQLAVIRATTAGGGTAGALAEITGIPALTTTEKVAISLILDPPERPLSASARQRIADAAAANNMTIEQYRAYVEATYTLPSAGAAPVPVDSTQYTDPLTSTVVGAEAMETLGEISTATATVFEEMKASGEIPANATLSGVDPATGSLLYTQPLQPLTEVEAIEHFEVMKSAGEIPPNAELTGFNVATQEFSFVTPLTEEEALEQFTTEIQANDPGAVFKGIEVDESGVQQISYLPSPKKQFDDWKANDPLAPADAEFRGVSDEGGFTYFSYSTAEIEIETADGKKTVKLSEWEEMSEIKRYELILGRPPTLTEWIGYCLLREDAELGTNIFEPNFSLTRYLPGATELLAALQTFVPGEQKEEKWARVAQAAQREWNDAYPEMKWTGSLVALPMEKMGIAAARAIYPQIKVTDITGQEWAQTGLAVALWTMPLWLPKVIAGIRVAVPKVTNLVKAIHRGQTGGLKPLKPTPISTKAPTPRVAESPFTRQGWDALVKAYDAAKAQRLTRLAKSLEPIRPRVRATGGSSGLPARSYPKPHRVARIGEVSNAEWLKQWKPSTTTKPPTPATTKAPTPVSIPQPPASAYVQWKAPIVQARFPTPEIVSPGGAGAAAILQAGAWVAPALLIPTALVVNTPVMTPTGTVINPLKTTTIVKSLGITQAQITGTQSLTATQAATLSRLLGITRTQLANIVKQGTLTKTIQKATTKLQNKLSGLTATQVQQLTKAITKAQQQPLTKTELKNLAATLNATNTDTKALVNTLTSLANDTKLVNQLQQQPITTTMPATKTLPLTETAPLTKTDAKTKTGITPMTLTGLKAGTKPPPPKPKKGWRRLRPPPDLPEGGEVDRKRPTVPAGTYTWKQGIGWRSLLPPYKAKKPLWSKLPPAGAVRTNLRTPAETIQIIRPTGREPKQLSVDLGVSDIFIKSGGKGVGPTIEFKGHGMRTDVGKRIVGPAKGLSLDNEAGGLLLEDEPTGIPERAIKGVSRRSKAPVRRKKSRNWLDKVASVKGYRPGDF